MISLNRRALAGLAACLLAFITCECFCWKWFLDISLSSKEMDRLYFVQEKFQGILKDASAVREDRSNAITTRRVHYEMGYQNGIDAMRKKVTDVRKKGDLDPSALGQLEQLDLLLAKESDYLSQEIPASAKKNRSKEFLPTGKNRNTKTADKIHRMASDWMDKINGEIAQKAATTGKLTVLSTWIFGLGFCLGLGLMGILTLLLRHSLLQETRALQEADRAKKLADSLEKNNSEISMLDNLVKSLQACQTVEEVAKTSILMSQALFTGVSGSVLTLGNSKTKVESITVFGKEPRCKSSFEMDECWAMRRSQVHLVNRLRNSLACQHFKDGFTPREYVCVPLAAQGKLLGMFHLNSSEEGNLQERQEKLASLMGEQIALALANIKLREELKNQSIRDPLTGLFNRRFLEESLEKEVAVADRKKGKFTVVMADIDHFKEFNDRFGHEAGDRILAEIGSFLNRTLRKGDVACRYGGEELVLLFPETGINESRKLAEKIKESISQLNVNYLNAALGQVTVSIGVAVYPEDNRTSAELLRQADIALYNAKSLGRNQVVLWQDISMDQRNVASKVRTMDLVENPVSLSTPN